MAISVLVRRAIFYNFLTIAPNPFLMPLGSLSRYFFFSLVDFFRHSKLLRCRATPLKACRFSYVIVK
jgi:hypothetical protein